MAADDSCGRGAREFGPRTRRVEPRTRGDWNSGLYNPGVRLTVRVQPNARKTVVGGRYGNVEPPVLVVRVSAPAIDGRANRACVAAVAEALGLRAGQIGIIAGASGRVKLLEIEGADPSRIAALLEVRDRASR